DEAVDVERIRTGRPLWVTAYPLMDRQAVPERLRRPRRHHPAERPVCAADPRGSAGQRRAAIRLPDPGD
ncbi:hypothetical protein, partial [Streptomyces bicolor]|uniref:hypothetical protein n=1 Tax=Streptomyces bicolor TaxID=66874 RepID=UPI001ADF31BE